MPELPEVESTKRGISKVLEHKIISHFVVRFPRLREDISSEFNELTNLYVNSIDRRGKYILIKTDQGTVLIHLGMSGHLTIVKTDVPVKKHDHVDIVIKDGFVIRLNDQRRFGLFVWIPLMEDPYLSKWLACLGPEPLTEEFTPEILYNRIHNKKACIKAVLMDNTVVVGIGNIYANEVLFRSHISPYRKACDVSKEECEIIVPEIKNILQASIKAGGSTIHDFSGSDGKPGHFAEQLQVYGRKGQNCFVCGAKIESTMIAGRSAFFCPKCQH